MNNSSLNILATSKYLPGLPVASDALDEILSLEPGHIERVCGIKQRYFANDESASQMAVKAIEQALQISKMSINDIDCLIAASGTMEQAIPCNAALILSHLQPKKPIPGFDINMTCLGSLQALDIAASLLSQGKYQTMLIVTSEIASVGIDWNDSKIAGNFGDGAAAIVLSADHDSSGSKILACHFATYPEGVELCKITGGGTRLHPRVNGDDYVQACIFQMQGKPLYRLAAKVLPEFLDQLLAQANIARADIDWVVPHQASSKALALLPHKLGIDPHKFINILSEHGNQIASSIPTALHESLNHYGLKKGDKILILGTGAGLSVGGMVLEL